MIKDTSTQSCNETKSFNVEFGEQGTNEIDGGTQKINTMGDSFFMVVHTSQTNPVPGNGTRPEFNQLTGYGMQPSLNYQNTGRIPDQRVDIDNQFYSKPRYDPLNMIEHYGEPVPTRNANTSRNNATPPAASELSSINNKKFIGQTAKVTQGPYKLHI